jgi:hypothetical protein
VKDEVMVGDVTSIKFVIVVEFQYPVVFFTDRVTE